VVDFGMDGRCDHVARSEEECEVRSETHVGRERRSNPMAESTQLGGWFKYCRQSTSNLRLVTHIHSWSHVRDVGL
jgi:hypothetical protein